MYGHWKGRGDEKFCRYNELFLGWRSKAGSCFEGQRRLDFSGVRAQCSKKRASFLLDFEVVSSSSHRWHSVLAWFVAWVFLTRWKKWRAVKPCENWSFISGVPISCRFLLLLLFPLHPINLRHLRGALLFGDFFFYISFHAAQRSWARQGPGSFFQPRRRWLSCAEGSSLPPPPPSAHTTDLSN